MCYENEGRGGFFWLRSVLLKVKNYLHLRLGGYSVGKLLVMWWSSVYCTQQDVYTAQCSVYCILYSAESGRVAGRSWWQESAS